MTEDRKPQQHYVPTSVEVRPSDPISRMLLSFDTREGYEVNLYLPKAIEDELRRRLMTT